MKGMEVGKVGRVEGRREEERVDEEREDEESGGEEERGMQGSKYMVKWSKTIVY